MGRKPKYEQNAAGLMQAERDRANAHAIYEENWAKLLKVTATAKLGQAAFEEPRAEAQRAHRKVVELDKIILQLRKRISN